MRDRCIVVVCLLAFATPGVRAQNLPTATPESVGLSASGLDEATRQLRAHVDDGDVAGVVAAVVRHGQLAYFESLGQIDLDAERAMPDDALFRLYSMTRPITSLAAMMLWEEDAFELDDPVSKFLPQFASQRVLVDAANPDPTVSRRRHGEMTVEHLLTHTSGLGGRNSALYRAEQVRLRSITLRQMVSNAARVPLYEDPGTRWRYGISTTILGRLVEIWSNLPLETFFEERVFGPLGMRDTVFWVDASRVDRFGPAYRPDSNGTLRPHAIEVVPFTERPTLTEGGVGLISMVPDYLRFAQLFLNSGELDGVRLLQPDTVAMMTVNRLPDTVLPIGFGSPQLGRGWGLGFCIVMDESVFPYPVSEGTFWWDGSSGTRFFVDPVRDMVTVIMAAASPARGNGFREAFTEAVYAAVVD